jgi:adenosylmethionine-8-amino-7-oxononanoate aminotransferase
VRGCQFIGALELLPKGGKAVLTPTSALGIKGSRLVREEGVIVRGIRDLIAIAPPLTATHEEIDIIFTAVGHALDKLWQ